MGTDANSRLAAGRERVARNRQISRIFRAVADPTRRAIVEKLSDGPASTMELARPFRMALPSFTQHLHMLQRCGVVRSRKEGRVRRFWLAPQSLATAEDWMAAQRALWNQRLDQLQEHLAETKT